jgi:large conductance mechanosensitive channel
MGAEFREFIQRGNVVDMALVDGILMPPIGLATVGVDFSELMILIGGTVEAPVTLNYGLFIQTLVNFLIIAFCVFLLVKGVNRLKRPEPAPAPAGPPEDVQLLMEIRDLLQRR